jgi:S1-C subfamily serine protease
MRKGDIITSVNRKPVENLDAFFKLIEGKKNTLLLRIVRGRSAAFLVIR